MLLRLQPLCVEVGKQLLYYLLLLYVGLEVLVHTVVKLDLVIGNGNRLGLSRHWARSALLIEH